MLLTVAIAVALIARQAPVAPTHYDAATTTVAILPSVNTSGDKFLAMTAHQVREADETLRRLFTERGFVVLGADQVAKIVTESKVDLSDEDNQRKDVLYGIGQTTKATILVFTAITKTWQKTTRDLLFDKLEGFASLKTWVLDVPTRSPIISGKTFEGRSTKNGPTGSERQVRAVRLGIETQLAGFLKPYPKVKSPRGPDGIEP